MKQYLDLLRNVRDNGQRQSNRTGIDSIFLPGAMMQFNNVWALFPAVTTKKLFFKKTVGELIGFLRGCDNAADFRALGCDVWNQNANEHGTDLLGNFVENQWLTSANRKGTDDLGRIYGVQWRKWNGALKLRHEYPNDQTLVTPVFDNDGNFEPEYGDTLERQTIDQVQNVLTKLITNPTDRRMIINAWRPDEFDQMALPPCPVMYQFLANTTTRELHLCLYQRSADLFLGVPFNIASAAMLLTVFAALTGFKPATFTHFLADAHIYVNHLEQVELQLSREPKGLPTLMYTGPGSDVWAGSNEMPILPGNVPCASVFNELLPEHFQLEGYDPHPAILAKMAV